MNELHSMRLPGPAGTPILLLHGWGHSIEITRQLGELLSTLRTVYLIDLPGHGRSAPPEDAWGMEEFAAVVRRFLDAEGIERAIGVGHSFGGKTLIKLAALHPERLERLVLINSSGLQPVRPFKKRVRISAINAIRKVVKGIDAQFGAKLFEQWFIPRFASPDYLQAGVLRQTFVRTVNQHLDEECRRIKVPTLLLWGELDPETPLEAGRRMHALIAGSRLVVLEGKGHVPFLDAGAHLCMFHIKGFLNEEHDRSSSSAAGG